jgi:hypothetical protein
VPAAAQEPPRACAAPPYLQFHDSMLGASRADPQFLCCAGLLQGYIVGCGLSGCATSALSFLSQLRADSSASSHAPKDVAPAAFMYFAASAGITGSCVLAFFLLIRLKYSRLKLGPYLASESRRQHTSWHACLDLDVSVSPAASLCVDTHHTSRHSTARHVCSQLTPRGSVQRQLLQSDPCAGSCRLLMLAVQCDRHSHMPVPCFMHLTGTSVFLLCVLSAGRAAAVAAEQNPDLIEQLLPGAPTPGLPPGKDPDALPSYHQPQLPGSSSAAQVRTAASNCLTKALARPSTNQNCPTSLQAAHC